MTATRRRRPERHVSRRIGSFLVSSLLAVATLAGLAYLVPSLFGYERYVITGGSMTGAIDKGAVAFERDVPVADLAVGDVITYQPPADSGVTNLVTHRIIEIGTAENGAPLFRTQGDANPDPDPWTFSLTAPDQPVVQFHVPHVGWVLVALADRDTRVVALGVPAGLIALASAVQLARGVRDHRRERHAKVLLDAELDALLTAAPRPSLSLHS